MTRSSELFKIAQTRIPGGVNSPVRAFRSVGGDPLFIHKGKGPYIFDVDGKRYIDYVNSWGPLILGHAHPAVLTAMTQAMQRGLSFGAPTELENLMAEQIHKALPSIELVRMVSSGTEATLSAIRLARGFTHRDLLVKFEGCYHGHSDSLLVKAGSGALTLGEPSSAGVPRAIAELTICLEYNNSQQVQDFFSQRGEQVAAIIVEPVAGNMNCIVPEPGFLETLRQVCNQYGSILIFDEVMTGFRVAFGGAQTRYQIKPDLTTLGKVIGGGMPAGAFGGRRDIMEQIAPLGPVYQAGTLSGNPISLAAGLATLEQISAPGFFENLEQHTNQLVQGLLDNAKHSKIPFTANQVGGMFGIFFTEEQRVTNYTQATACNLQHFKHFFHAMLQRGVYFAPSAFEAGFMSAAHSELEIAATLQAAQEVFQQFSI